MRFLCALIAASVFCISCQKRWSKKELLPEGHDVWVGDELSLSLKNGESYTGICTKQDQTHLIFRRANIISANKWEPYGETIKVPWDSVLAISSTPRRPAGYIEAQRVLLNERKEAFEKFYKKISGGCFVRVKLKDGTIYDPAFTTSISDWKLGLQRAKELNVSKLSLEEIDVDWEDIDTLDVLAGPDGRPVKH